MRQTPSGFTRKLVLVLALMALGALGASGTASAQDRSERAAAKRALSDARAALAGRATSSGHDATAVLHLLHQRMDDLPPSDRRAAKKILARPADEGDPDGDAESNADYGDIEEETPLCSEEDAPGRFCIHYVATGEHAPDETDDTGREGVPDYVERMLAVFEQVHEVENTELGWPEAPSDGDLGGGPELDVYIANIGGGEETLYGYVVTDAEQEGDDESSQHSYQVMDNDYSTEEFEFEDGVEPDDALRVTAAHEYVHVLQNGINYFGDLWWSEGTATYLEEQVYPDVNDYLQYVEPFAAGTGTPLTQWIGDGDLANYHYGTTVFHHFLAARHEPEVIRDAWIASEGRETGLVAFDRVLSLRGSSFAAEFGQFAAAVAEWRATESPFPDNSLYDDAARTGTITIDGPTRVGEVDHTSYKFFDAVAPTAGRLRLEVELPAGVPFAAAIVGGPGPDGGDSPIIGESVLDADGGVNEIEFDVPEGTPRVTGVLANLSGANTGYDAEEEEWDWTQDAQPYRARLTRVVDEQERVPPPTPPPPPAPQPGPDPTPNPGPTPIIDTFGPSLSFPTSNRVRRARANGVVRFDIGPLTEDVSGVLTMKSQFKVRVKKGRRKRILNVGNVSFQVLARQPEGVLVTMSRRARKALRRLRVVDAIATVTARDAAGNATVQQYRFTLRAPKRV